MQGWQKKLRPGAGLIKYVICSVSSYILAKLCMHLQQEDSEYEPGETEEAELLDDWDDEEESDVLAAVLLVGPTGCGKTAMAYSAAEVGTWEVHALDMLLLPLKKGRWLWQVCCHFCSMLDTWVPHLCLYCRW